MLLLSEQSLEQSRVSWQQGAFYAPCFTSVLIRLNIQWPQRHILETGDLEWLPGQLGDKWIDIMYAKIVCTGPTRSAKAGQKSLVRVPARRAQGTNQGRTPLICTPWVPVCIIVSTVSRGHPPPSLISLINAWYSPYGFKRRNAINLWDLK